MTFRKRKQLKGVSLLELLVSIMLFCMVMITFAMVFPTGFRLNIKTRNESNAYKIADGIMNKLHNMPFLEVDPANFSTTELTLEHLASTGWSSVLDTTYGNYFLQDVPAPFYINDGDIRVEILDRSFNRGTLAKLTVVLSWNESVKRMVIVKNVTLISYRSRNHL